MYLAVGSISNLPITEMRKKRVKKKEADQADYKIMTKPVDSITLESNLKSCHAVAAKFVQN